MNRIMPDSLFERTWSTLNDVWNLVSFPLEQPEQAQIRQRLLTVLQDMVRMRSAGIVEVELADLRRKKLGWVTWPIASKSRKSPTDRIAQLEKEVHDLRLMACLLAGDQPDSYVWAIQGERGLAIDWQNDPIGIIRQRLVDRTLQKGFGNE